MVTSALLTATLAWHAPAADPAMEAKVKKIFDDACTMCHSAGGDPMDPGGLNLDVEPNTLLGRKSVVSDKPLIDPGNPGGSYLLDKMYGTEGIEGELMPLGMGALPQEDLKAVEDWIAALPADAGPTPADGTGPGEADGREPPRESPKPFHGTHQIVLPTTTTLGKKTLQFRIDHRFGRIGTERGAFGLDAGVIMSIGLAYGIFDGWDVRLRRTNSRKGWELGTKYVPIRQEVGWPVSFGGYASVDFFRDFDVANAWSGNFLLMVSRLWFERWSTMLTTSYSIPTNHDSRVLVDFGDGEGPVLVKDTRGTFVFGLASTVWLGKRKRWGIDFEWLLPVPDGADPNKFYYHGGDADPGGTRLGAWALGGSYFTGKHFFQVFFTNNREIHLNLAAPGGQVKNPFKTEGVDSKNPFHQANFFLGFNLGRRWSW